VIVTEERRVADMAVTTERRKRGRPSVSVGVESAPASTTLPLPVYNRLMELSRVERVPFSEFLRRILTNYQSKNRSNDAASVF
jgi:hypothetical protein